MWDALQCAPVYVVVVTVADQILPAQLRGHNVCVIERRRVEGRAQEWNASREELQVMQQISALFLSHLVTLASLLEARQQAV